MKNNSHLYKKRRFNYFYICNKSYFSPAFEKLLENPDAFIRNHILKEDKTFTTTVGLVTIDDKDLVIKRYNLKKFLHQVKRAIQPSRAARCWHYAHLLQHYNINTPTPVAMIEKRIGLLRREAYFIYEHIPGPDGFSVFIDHPLAATDAKICAVNTETLIEKLHGCNISHGDLKGSNFIYHNNVPYIIDLDAMRLHKNKKIAHKKFSKDRQRFLLNWENLPAAGYFRNYPIK